MANEEAKSMVESHPMNSGDDPHSYAQNSSYHERGLAAAKQIINEAIGENLDINTSSFDSSNPFRIADFGCSTGPNTFIAVQYIMEAVEFKYKSVQHNTKSPEFHVFFSDHTNNDFNTLFRTLPPSRRYFAAGVPGSFHARLFPESTLCVAYSSYAVQWLSKLPKEVVDINSPAFNKAYIHCLGTSKEATETYKAYLAQFNKDMEVFLTARAQELVGGSLMIMLVPVLPSGVLHAKTNAGFIYDLLGSCLRDMAKTGLISDEKVDRFNIPMHFPSPEELQAVTERNGYFSIEKMEILNHPVSHMSSNVQMFSSMIRAVMQGLIEEHFGIGNAIVDELFERYTKKVAENHIIFDDDALINIDLFIILKRKLK